MGVRCPGHCDTALSSGGTEELNDCKDIFIKAAALDRYAPVTTAYWRNLVVVFFFPLFHRTGCPGQMQLKETDHDRSCPLLRSRPRD